MTISKPIEKVPILDDSLKVASETAAKEAQIELDQLLKQFEDWSKENPKLFGNSFHLW
jgi:hypothetical protein|tara:strand:+ start:364 stop:537 length:174 start_codon:yes stop_codon:yes gene_type:complete